MDFLKIKLLEQSIGIGIGKNKNPSIGIGKNNTDIPSLLSLSHFLQINSYFSGCHKESIEMDIKEEKIDIKHEPLEPNVVEVDVSFPLLAEISYYLELYHFQVDVSFPF